MKKFTISVLCLLSLITACKKDKEDEKKDEKPVFTSLKIEGVEQINSTEEIEIHLGEAFEFEVGVSDDVELSELQIEVHSAFDGHNHEKARVFAQGTDTLKIGPIIKSLSGTTDSKIFHVFSATDTNYRLGEHHLEMILLDEVGNRTEKIVELHLEGKK